MPLPPRCHTVAVELPCRCRGVAMPLPCRSAYHGVAMPLPCRCHAVAMQLPRSCHAVAVESPLRCSPRRGHAVAMSWQRRRNKRGHAEEGRGRARRGEEGRGGTRRDECQGQICKGTRVGPCTQRLSSLGTGRPRRREAGTRNSHELRYDDSEKLTSFQACNA